jgi:anti-sigma B factor antagonist
MGMVAPPATSLADRHVRITVDEVDRATAERFAEELATHEPGAYCLVVDLAEVSFMDASGVAALLAVDRRMKDAGGVIALRNARSAVRRVLDVLDLKHLLAPR